MIVRCGLTLKGHGRDRTLKGLAGRDTRPFPTRRAAGAGVTFQDPVPAMRFQAQASGARHEIPGRSALAAPRWAYVAALAGCVALAILCRLPFLAVPLTNDEGGYAYVARQWAAGARLYGDAWGDRPQGLILLFRLFISVAPSTAGLRLCGAIYVGLSVLLLAYVGSRLYGWAGGLCAAALYAVVSSGPQIEGFIVNGELLATLPAVAAVALLLRSRHAARPALSLFLAGVAAGGALLVKQSAIDGSIVVLLFAPSGAGLSVRARLRRVAFAFAGLAVAPALSAMYGAATGWSAYINAVVLDNLRYRSFDASANTLNAATAGFGWFWSEDAVLIILALIAIVLPFRGERREAGGGSGYSGSRHWIHANETQAAKPTNGLPPLASRLPPPASRLWSWLPLPWLAAATVAVTLGGLYSRHYFVQLLPPLCLLAAAGLVTGARTVRRVPWTALLAVVPLAALAMTARADASYYAGSSPVAISQRLYGWPVYTYQAALVDFLRQRVPAGQPFFVAYAAAPLHYLTGRPSVTHYLWRRPLGTIPGAYTAALRAVERGEPVCVIPVQPVAQSPGDARMRAALSRRYVVAWRRPGLTVLCRHP